MSQEQTTKNVWGIGGLELSVRAQNVLTAEGICSIHQACELGYEGLLRLPRMPAKVAREIWTAINNGNQTKTDRVCHNEQLRVWASSLIGVLSQDGFIRDDMNYDDCLALEQAVMREVASIVSSALSHPELANG